MQRTSAHKISSQKSYFNLRLDIKHVPIPNIQQSSVKIVYYSTCSSDMYTRIENTVFPKSAFQLCFLQKKSNVITTASQSSSNFQLSIEKQNQSRGSEWGSVFSVICPYFLVFTVKLAIFLMFIVLKKNTV